MENLVGKKRINTSDRATYLESFHRNDFLKIREKLFPYVEDVLAEVRPVAVDTRIFDHPNDEEFVFECVEAILKRDFPQIVCGSHCHIFDLVPVTHIIYTKGRELFEMSECKREIELEKHEKFTATKNMHIWAMHSFKWILDRFNSMPTDGSNRIFVPCDLTGHNIEEEEWKTRDSDLQKFVFDCGFYKHYQYVRSPKDSESEHKTHFACYALIRKDVVGAVINSIRCSLKDNVSSCVYEQAAKRRKTNSDNFD